MRGSHEVMQPRSLSTFPSRPLALAPVRTLPDVELPMLGVSMSRMGQSGQEESMNQDYGHDPALCQSPVCSWCDAFNYGYAVGKAKAHFELRSLDHDPAAVYGGEPCKTTRVVTTRLEACYQPPGAVDRAEASPSEGPA